MIERVPWDRFLPQFVWRQGEHVSLIGPTGGGKTTLALEVLDRRSHVVVFATKPKDKTLDGLVKSHGFRKVKSWSEVTDQDSRVLLWPPANNLESHHLQRRTFYDALAAIYRQGCWCVFADELRYLTENLGLRAQFATVYTQGRSIDISVVATTQRPAHVPLEMYSQATHLFLWRDSDDRNLKRLAEIGGVNTKLLAKGVVNLPRHEVIYTNTRTGRILRTKVVLRK